MLIFYHACLQRFKLGKRSMFQCSMVFKRIIIQNHNLYNIYTTNECIFNLLCLSCCKRLFLCLDSFILSLSVVCLPVCVTVVEKIVKQLQTQTRCYEKFGPLTPKFYPPWPIKNVWPMRSKISEIFIINSLKYLHLTLGFAPRQTLSILLWSQLDYAYYLNIISSVLQ